jgi:Trk K+ transport system NAD-binding subunit
MYPNEHTPNGHWSDETGDRRVIVVGNTGLALRFIMNLPKEFKVVSLLNSGFEGQAAAIREEAARSNGRIRVVEDSNVGIEFIQAVGLVDAYAVALMAQNDVGNLELALKIREVSRSIHGEESKTPRLILRMYSRELRDRIRHLLGDTEVGVTKDGVYVESDADMVAPTYAALALQKIPPGDIELWGRRLYLKREPDHRSQTQWTVAASIGDTVDLLPGGEADDDAIRILCLERAHKRHLWRSVRESAGRFITRTTLEMRRTIDTKLRLAAVILLAILFGGILVIDRFGGEDPNPQSWMDAMYIVMLAAGGGIDPDLDAPGWTQVAHAVVTMSGALFIPVVTGAIVQALVGRRIALSEGRVIEPVRHHVIIVGLGNIGTRVVERLRMQRIPVVAIEKNRDVAGVHTARKLGAQVLLGDASRIETLQEAGIQHCRSLVAMAKWDSENIEAALAGMECRKDLRTVLRIYDEEFARLVRRSFNDNAVGADARHSCWSAPSIAAQSFAATLTEDEIEVTVPVRGHLVYIATLTVAAGSRLDDAPAHDASRAGRYFLLAVRRGDRDVWRPDDAFRLEAGDVVLVLVTGEGLEYIRRRCAAPEAV